MSNEETYDEEAERRLAEAEAPADGDEYRDSEERAESPALEAEEDDPEDIDFGGDDDVGEEDEEDNEADTLEDPLLAETLAVEEMLDPFVAPEDLDGNLDDDFGEGNNNHVPKRVKMVAKKPPSRWVLYLAEQRRSVMEANPDMPFAEVTKYIAAQYKELPVEEAERLDAIIEEKKQEYLSALAYNKEIEDSEPASSSSATFRSGYLPPTDGSQLILPQARIKRIMKMDDEVKIVSKESIAAATKATELFIARLALKACATTSLRGGRTVNLNDLLHTIHTNRAFSFLDMDFPKPTTTSAGSNKNPSSTSSNAAHKSSSNSGTGSNSRSLGVSSKIGTRKKDRSDDQVENGKYSMLNFISGTKRSNRNEEEKDIEEGDAHFEVDRGDDDVVDEEVEDDEQEVADATSNTSKEVVTAVPSHLEW